MVRLRAFRVQILEICVGLRYGGSVPGIAIVTIILPASCIVLWTREKLLNYLDADQNAQAMSLRLEIGGKNLVLHGHKIEMNAMKAAKYWFLLQYSRSKRSPQYSIYQMGYFT